jgi:hypothetical protein
MPNNSHLRRKLLSGASRRALHYAWAELNRKALIEVDRETLVELAGQARAPEIGPPEPAQQTEDPQQNWNADDRAHSRRADGRQTRAPSR